MAEEMKCGCCDRDYGQDQFFYICYECHTKTCNHCIEKNGVCSQCLEPPTKIWLMEKNAPAMQTT